MEVYLFTSNDVQIHHLFDVQGGGDAHKPIIGVGPALEYVGRFWLFPDADVHIWRDITGVSEIPGLVGRVLRSYMPVVQFSAMERYLYIGISHVDHAILSPSQIPIRPQAEGSRFEIEISRRA